MDHLFCYGTLQDIDVQHYLFGRTLVGQQDEIQGFKCLKNVIYNRYHIVYRTNFEEDIVKGTVFEVSVADLKKADVYETTAYTRIKVVLKSKKTAWVYIKNSK